MSTTCVLCKGKKYDVLYKIGNYHIVKCHNCGLVYTDPNPSKKDLDIFYKNFDFKDGFSFETTLRTDAKRVLKDLKALGFTGGNLLDVGCGAGFFMDESRSAGWKTFGVDTAKIPTEYAAKKLKLNVAQKDILNLNSRKKYDAISLQQVIEHLTDPFPILKKINSLLKPKGVFYISTPNIKSWLSIILKERFNYIIPPEHVVYYSPQTLTLLLEKAGFKVINTATYGYPMDMGGIYRTLREGKNYQATTRSSVKSKRTKSTQAAFNWKRFVFEKYICQYGYPLLNLFHKGSMIELYAKKS